MEGVMFLSRHPGKGNLKFPPLLSMDRISYSILYICIGQPLTLHVVDQTLEV